MHYVYVLHSKKDQNLYTRVTSDLRRRLDEHNRGYVKSTKLRRPLTLIYYEACLNGEDAKRCEKYLKSGMDKRYLKQRLRVTLEEL
jgi:putative endonuclease